MKYFKKSTLGLVAIAIIVIITWCNSLGDSGFTDLYDLQFEAIPQPTGPGPFTLKIIIKPKFECQQVTLILKKVDNLLYDGQLTLLAPVTASGSATFEIPVAVPEKDTAGFYFRISNGGNANIPAAYYWAAIDDQVKFFPGDPRVGKEEPWKPVIIHRGDSLKAAWDKLPKDGRQIIQFSDEEGNPISREEYEELHGFKSRIIPPDFEYDDTTKLVLVRNDSGYYYYVKKEDMDKERVERRNEDRYAKMRELEKTPLTESDGETFIIGDSIYDRFRGEYKFHLSKTVKDPTEEMLRTQDSLVMNTSFGDKIIEVVFDLRDPEDYEYIKSLIDNLEPTDRQGFYSAKIKRRFLYEQKFQEKGINVSRSRPKNRDKNKNETGEDLKGDNKLTNNSRFVI